MTFLDDIAARTGWPLERIGEVFEVQQGKALSASARAAGPPQPFLRTRNIVWGAVDVRDLDTMSFTDAESERLRLRVGDLLCCEGGDIGRTAIWRGEHPDCLFQNHVHRLRAKSREVHPAFVRYWLEAAFRRFGVYEGAGNKTTIPNLSAARLKQLDLPIPDRDEQGRIVTVLAALEDALAAQRAERDLLLELFNGMLREVFERGVRQTSPSSWPRARVGEVARLFSGGTPPKSDPTLWSGALPWVSPKDMKQLHIRDAEDHVSERGAAFSRLVPPGTVLIVIRGMILAKEIPLAITDVPVCFNQDMKALVPRSDVEPLYLLYAVLSARPALASQIGTSAHGTRRIGSTAIEQLFIPIPPRPEQGLIGNGLDAIRELADLANRSVSLIAAAYDRALADLLSGRVLTSPAIPSDRTL